MYYKKSFKVWLIAIKFLSCFIIVNTTYSNNLDIKNGEVLYNKRCANCHGKNAKGKSNGFFLSPNLTVFNKGYDQFLNILTNGYGRMPAWGGRSILTKIQIQELSSYLKYIGTDKADWN